MYAGERAGRREQACKEEWILFVVSMFPAVSKGESESDFSVPPCSMHGASFDFGVASGIEGDGVGSGSCLSGEGGDQSVLDKVGGKRPHCASTPWP